MESIEWDVPLDHHQRWTEETQARRWRDLWYASRGRIESGPDHSTIALSEDDVWWLVKPDGRVLTKAEHDAKLSAAPG